MKILILSQFFYPEPALIPSGLASELARRGHDVQVVTGFPNYPQGRLYPGYSWSLTASEFSEGVHVHRVPLIPSHDDSAPKRIASYLSFGISAAVLGTAATWRQDLTYVYHPPPTAGIAALLWQLIRSAPYVYHVQDLWPESVVNSGMTGNRTTTRALERGISGWCNLLYRRAAAVPVLSPGFKSKLQALGVPGDKLHVIYNWTDESVFGVAQRDTSALPVFGIPNPFTILYAGNLGHYQGLDTAIRAAARLRNELPRMRLVLMGDGMATLELRALAERLGATNVVFAGRHPHNEMGETMQRASVLLVSLKDLPFFAWTIPSKTQAAMASGRPVLMSVRGDAANLIRRAGAGVCCAPSDEQQMVAAMRSLYELTPGELDAIGRRAQQFYRSRLSLEQGVSQLEALMIEAVASRTPHCNIFGGRRQRPPLRGSRRIGGDGLR